MSDENEIPMIYRWKGVDIRDLTREELIDVVVKLGEQNESLREHASRMGSSMFDMSRALSPFGRL